MTIVMIAAFFHSNIMISLTINVLMLITIKHGVQQKLMLMEIIMETGKTAMKIAKKVRLLYMD